LHFILYRYVTMAKVYVFMCIHTCAYIPISPRLIFKQC
jgi:hypothetical protein